MSHNNTGHDRRIHILFCSNRQYSEQMAIAIASLLKNNPHHRFSIHVVLSETAIEERDRIERTARQFPNAETQFKTFDCAQIRDFRVDRHITLDTYVRLFLPDLLPVGIERIIYLDCDLLVCSDIGELWNTNLGQCTVGAVPDAFSENHVALGFDEDEIYFNAGVLVIDVVKWRRENLTDSLLNYIGQNTFRLRYHDQDALNGVLRGRIHPLPLRWNFTPRHADADPRTLGISRREFMAIRRKPGIVHFATGYKPWHDDSEPHYKTWYYRYRSLTPWATQPNLLARESLALLISRVSKRIKARLKWHFPLFARLLRRWTGLGDPTLQRKFAIRRSYGG